MQLSMLLPIGLGFLIGIVKADNTYIIQNIPLTIAFLNLTGSDITDCYLTAT
jgi:hypothetical protein